MMTDAALAHLHWLRDLDDDLADSDGPLPDAAEVVVIGGGYVGGATAYWLARHGAAALLIERRGLATGASGRNAGFIAPGLGMSFTEAAARYGRGGALDRLAFTRRGRDLALALIEDLGIDCDLEASGGLTLAASAEEWDVLRANGAALRREGVPIDVLSHAELGAHCYAPIPKRFPGGLYNPETVLVNPAKLSVAIARAAQRLGVRLATHTEVYALADRPDGRIAVATSRGMVTAGHVVLATNAWSPLLVGFLKDRITPVRGQMLATAQAPPAFRRAMSTNWGYEYWSQRADGTIVLGGARWATPDRDEGYYAEDLNPAIQDALYGFLIDTFPVVRGTGVTRRWSGIMGFSRDGYPFVGPLPWRERLIVAAGFTGHGGPYFALVGRSVAELIVKGRSEEPLHHYALDREL